MNILSILNELQATTSALVEKTNSSLFQGDLNLSATTTPENIVNGSLWVSASQGLRDMVIGLGNIITRTFNDAVYAVSGIFDKVFAKEVHTDKLCVSNNSGETCISREQLDSLLGNVISTNTQVNPTPSPTSTSTSDGVPIISINGNNPANINVGDVYNDLGAVITGPTDSDKNLGIHLFVDGVLSEFIQIDTSIAGTHTIDYVVTNLDGTATSTRNVVVNSLIISPVATSTDPIATSTTP